MLFRRLLLLVSILCTSVSAAGLAVDSLFVPQLLKEELINSSLRKPDKSYFDRYLNDKDFAYVKEAKPVVSNTFLMHLWEFIVRIFTKGLSIILYRSILVRIIFFALVLLLLYIIITKTRLYKIFYTDIEVPMPDFEEIDVLNEEYDFNRAIGMQLSQRNYRGAVRLLHLKMLKELDSHERIRYSKEKTNRDYSRELGDINLRNSFISLTGIYNRVWYGNYSLSEEEFESMASGFYQFSEELNAG
jgi:hypothetical protein